MEILRNVWGNYIVFTHGDLVPQNILVENEHVTGIVDWEQAGLYPEYGEHVKALWEGCIQGRPHGLKYCQNFSVLMTISD